MGWGSAALNGFKPITYIGDQDTTNLIICLKSDRPTFFYGLWGPGWKSLGIWWLSSRMREVMRRKRERKGERRSNTLCRHRKSHRDRKKKKAKRRDWGHRVKYIRRRCIYLNVRKKRPLLSVKRKWTRMGSKWRDGEGCFGYRVVK